MHKLKKKWLIPLYRKWIPEIVILILSVCVWGINFGHKDGIAVLSDVIHEPLLMNFVIIKGDFYVVTTNG